MAQRNNSALRVDDGDIQGMRDRFESEMRRVEEEMGRLRREFEGYTPKVSPGATNGHSPHSYTSSTNSPRYDLPAVPRYDPQLDSIKSPLIRDESDGKTLRLRFDVSHYAPEEIKVRTVDNRLQVQARHEEKSPQRTVYREYNQEFMLPRGTNPEVIRSSLSVDGVLTVEAPLPPMAGQPSPINAAAPQHSPRPISHRGLY